MAIKDRQAVGRSSLPWHLMPWDSLIANRSFLNPNRRLNCSGKFVFYEAGKQMKMTQKDYSTFIGVDVSKAKIDVAWSTNGPVEQIANAKAEISKMLFRKIADPTRTLVTLEATGGYESLLVELLQLANIRVAVINPRRVRDFGKAIGKDAKTDPIDAALIAYYGEVVKPNASLPKTQQEKKIEALVTRRRQLLDLVNQESNRVQQTSDDETVRLIKQSLKHLKTQLKSLDGRIATAVASDVQNARRITILESFRGVGIVTISTRIAELPELGSLNRQAGRRSVIE